MPSVPLAFFADSAVANEADDKLYVIGGGRRSLSFASFPGTWARLALAVGVEFSVEEAKNSRHSVKIEANGPEGNPIIQPLNAAFIIQPDQYLPNEPIYTHFVFNLENIMFPAEGTYVFAITVDGQRVSDVPLRAVQSTGPVPPEVLASGMLNEGYQVFSRGDVAGAQKIFEEVVASFPSVPGGYNNLGFVLLTQGNAAPAKVAFIKARELGYHQRELLDANIATAQYLVGDTADALVLFEHCLEKYGFTGEAVLMGIREKEVFPVHLRSASDYVALMMLDAGWSAFRESNALKAQRHVEGAESSELFQRDEESAKKFADAVKALRGHLSEAGPATT